MTGTDETLAGELRPIIEAALEPPPKPLPEQDSRVGEAMAGQADSRAHAEWSARVRQAQWKLANRGHAILAALAAKPDQTALLRSILADPTKDYETRVREALTRIDQAIVDTRREG